MRIERINAVGFGCLEKHELAFDTERTTLVLAPNEAGKSTILAAIEVALYGFPSAQTAEGRDMRRCYKPWSGGPSRIVLGLIDENEHRYEIESAILDADGQPVDQMAVSRDGQDVTDEMVQHAGCPGEWLFRLSRDDFRRSVLVRQGELEAVARNTQGLVQHLEAVATSAEVGASATAAQGHLSEALKNYREPAGLAHWATTYLSNAKGWSRVESSLNNAIDKYERRRQALEKQRDALRSEEHTSELQSH